MNDTPAFPVSLKWGNDLKQYNGMTLRDFMAANAMQGIMVGNYQKNFNYIAETAYEMADAMLKARGEA